MNWLSISPTSGHGNTQITLSASTLTGLEDRIATLIATGSQEGQTLSATTVITQKYLTLTEIYFENLTWSTDVAWSGGTATKNNCSFSIIAKYSDNSTEDITNLANVTGSLFVPFSGEGERHSAGTLTLTATYEDKTCYGNVMVYQEAFDPLKEPLTFKIISGGTIVWKSAGTPIAKTISYSKDNGDTWTNITSNEDGANINVNSGDVIIFKGDNSRYANGLLTYNAFQTTGDTLFSVQGNIMSLIDSTGFATAETLTDSCTFCKLFYNCAGLTSAENLILPATTLAEYCYTGMFYGCSNLTSAPALPSETMADSCYRAMFYYCTSLKTAPALPATTLASDCYKEMFDSCTSLTTAPVLPAIDLAGGCYERMFRRCSSLNYIKCLGRNISVNSCTYLWVSDVASTGTFIKNPYTRDWETGTSGIPKGWVVRDDS